MKKENNPIDEVFKRGIEGKELKPSVAVWEKIEEATASSDSRKGGFYFMRAAVVTVLVGLSSWMYLSNNDIVDIIEPETNITNIIEANDKNEDEPKGTAAKKNDPKEKKEENKDKGNDKKTEKKNSKRKNITPLIKTRVSPSSLYVVNDLEIADESSLYDEEPLIMAEDLKVNEKSKPKKFKLKYRVPVTQKSFYADKGETQKENKPKLAEKVFAYANDQFTNLLNGEPLELPEVPETGKPQLEINIGKLFKNN